MLYLLISLTTFYIYFILKTVKATSILEKEKYSIKKYFKNIFKEPLKTFGALELGFIILIIIALSTNEKVTGICTVLFYMVLSLKLLKEKNKFKFKADNIRIFVITLLLFVALNVPIIMDCMAYENKFISYNPMFIYYSLLYILIYLLWFIVALAGLINKLFKKKNSKKKSKGKK